MSKSILMLGGAILLSAFLFADCSRRPKEILSEKKMVSLMADMQLAEAYINTTGRHTYNSDERYELGNRVLAAHGVTREELDTTLAWYGRNMDDYSNLYAAVDKEILKKRKRLLADDDNNHSFNDDADLWPFSRHGVISSLGNSDAFILSINAPELDKGEVLEWSMHITNPVQITGVLGVEYEDGSGDAVVNIFTGRPKLEMHLQTDTGRTVRRVYGTLSAKEKNSLPVHADSIMLVRLPFDSVEYYKIRAQRRYGVPAKTHVSVVTPEKIESSDSIVNTVRPGTETPDRIARKPQHNSAPSPADNDKRKRIMPGRHGEIDKTMAMPPKNLPTKKP